MATKRVYKEPYTKEKIISEFERCKETQFDPKIADIVIKLIKEDRLRYGTELKEEAKEDKNKATD
jgi:response regulator RpfG family c-di-GMP phosphodiesterase